jgi:hypothetical protein
MTGEHAIGQEVSKLALRAALHDEFGDEVQVRGRVDFVRDASVDDAQDRALLAGVGSNLLRWGEPPSRVRW